MLTSKKDKATTASSSYSYGADPWSIVKDKIQYTVTTGNTNNISVPNETSELVNINGRMYIKNKEATLSSKYEWILNTDKRLVLDFVKQKKDLIDYLRKYSAFVNGKIEEVMSSYYKGPGFYYHRDKKVIVAKKDLAAYCELLGVNKLKTSIFDGILFTLDDKGIKVDYFTGLPLSKGHSTSLILGENNKKLYTISDNKSLNLLPYCVDLKTYAIDESIFINLGYKELLSTGDFTTDSRLLAEDRKGSKLYSKPLFLYQDPLMIEFEKDNNTFKNTFGIDYTFGVEFETNEGCIPLRILKNHPFDCVRDGSLPETGGEYTSLVLQGDKGLNYVKEFCKELTKRCSVNAKCSLHLHIGHRDKKVFRTRLFNSAMYVLGYRIQDELFELFPMSRRKFDYANLSITKQYCKKIPLEDNLKEVCSSLVKSKSQMEYKHALGILDLSINRLFLLNSDFKLKETFFLNYNRKHSEHPCSVKWHRLSRYYYLNLVNLIFDSKGTVEFRCHSGTTNYRKFYNWLLICMALVKYAEKFPLSCLDFRSNVDLNYILSKVYSKETTFEVMKYVNERKEKFSDEKMPSSLALQKELEEYAWDTL